MSTYSVMNDEQFGDYQILRQTHKRLFCDACRQLRDVPTWDSGSLKSFDSTGGTGETHPANINRPLRRKDILLYDGKLYEVMRSGEQVTDLFYGVNVEPCYWTAHRFTTSLLRKTCLLIPREQVEAVQNILEKHREEYVGNLGWLKFEAWYYLSLACRVLEYLENSKKS